MASVDLFGIKERIVSILKADTTNLWDATPSDKTKFRKIEAGAPTPMSMKEPPLPRCWITSDTNVCIIKNPTTVSNNTPAGTLYEMMIKIVFIVEAKDGPKTEEDVDDFQKSIIEQMQGNYDLRTDGGAESTRVADSSKFQDSRQIPGMIGDAVQGRELRFKVWSRV